MTYNMFVGTLNPILLLLNILALRLIKDFNSAVSCHSFTADQSNRSSKDDG